MKYNTILFDLDGTLTDSAPGIINAIRYALTKLGRPIPDEATLNQFIGPPLIDSFQRYCGMDMEDAERTLVLYREYYSQRGLLENHVYAGVEAMLSRLKGEGKRLILATSKPETFALHILEHFDLLRWFDAVHGATLDETRNVKADIIAWALTHSGKIGNAVMVGDRWHDILGAKANNIDAIGVTYGYGDLEELQKAGATMIANCPEEVVERCC